QDLPDALAKRFKEYGGNLMLLHFVEKIKIEENKPTGIMLKNDEFISSKYVVSNCDATYTFFELLRGEINNDELLSWLRIGAQHLLSTTYCDVEVILMRFPDRSNDILVILREECSPGHEKFKLTIKEKEILGHLIKGLRNKEIATSLNMSPHTVNAHLDSIYNKFGVTNRLAAAIIALKNGFALPKDISQKNFVR
ncbi:MAG: LuxR C-terminal-related transcriptional regulator, partial [Nitrospirota bacterium]